MSLHVLLPARFMLWIGHLVAVIMLFFTKEANIVASLPTNPSITDESAVRTSVDAALFVAVLCFAIDLLGSTFSIFSNVVHLVQIIGHFLGGIYVAYIIGGSWHYETIWHTVLLANMIPSLFELFNLVKVCCKERGTSY